ncbi:MAG TPA: amino acid permease [Pirellulales bacterium]|jgi:amino acid transporter|nr:amino acid permease [Pirellulales bacterium]
MEALPAAPRRQLTLFDTTSMIVGIIIGSSVYVTAPTIAQNVAGTTSLLAVWLLGGAFALVGSLCYAELVTALPAEGGDYVYLTRAYGRPAGFLFAWCELWLVRPGAIGSVAFVFAQYADEILPLEIFSRGLGKFSPVIYAGGVVVLVTGVNLLGVVTGKWTQNILTVAKVIGLVMVIAVGFSVKAAETPPLRNPATFDWWFANPLALILILYAYGGWNDMAFVGAEVRDPDRNIVRALLLGTVAVTTIYLLINAAFVHALGFEGVRTAEAVAAQVTQLGLGRWGGKTVSLLVAISTLGAINGMMFTGARIYYALGTQHRLFRPLGVWSARRDAPVASLLLQGAITLGLVVGFGWSEGVLSQEAFERMARFTSPPFWFFLSLVSLSIMVLRWREPELKRPYRTPFVWATAVLFFVGCAYMLWSSCAWALSKLDPQVLWTVGAIAAGIIACAVDWYSSDR